MQENMSVLQKFQLRNKECILVKINIKFNMNKLLEFLRKRVNNLIT